MQRFNQPPVCKNSQRLYGYIHLGTRQDVEHVQATFMENADALAYADHLDPETLTMHNYELLGSYEAGKI